MSRAFLMDVDFFNFETYLAEFRVVFDIDGMGTIYSLILRKNYMLLSAQQFLFIPNRIFSNYHDCS